MSVFIAASLLSALVAPVFGHLGMWHPAAYGYDASTCWGDDSHLYDSPVNTDFLRNPLRLDQGLSFDAWWAHGCRRAPPRNGAILDLPAGGKITAEISCNKAFTKYGLVPSQLRMVGDLPCDINVWDGQAHYGNPDVEADNGPMHTASKETAAGCSMSIAYKSDVYDVTPEDLVIFTTNATCPWTREIDFQIPADLPPCPNGKCICAWNWMHGASHGEGYANEVYHIMYDCNVVNTQSTRKISNPKVAAECKSDPSQCVKGAKQGLYWQGAQLTGWNIPNLSKPNLPMRPPTYNMDWGFQDGAQNDIFEPIEEAASHSSTSQTPSDTPTSSSSETPVASSTSTSTFTEDASSSAAVPTHNRAANVAHAISIIDASKTSPPAIVENNVVSQVITTTSTSARITSSDMEVVTLTETATHTFYLTAPAAADPVLTSNPQKTKQKRNYGRRFNKRAIHGRARRIGKA